MMNSVGFFEIQSSRPEREMAFYGAVFGWSFERDERLSVQKNGSYVFEFYRINTGHMPGALLTRQGEPPAPVHGTNAFLCSLWVNNFDEAAAAVLAHGGKEIMKKFAVPGRCWQGYFLDPDNNAFGMFEVDELAG